MGIIKILEHSRLPIIEFPTAVVLCEMNDDRTSAFWESYVWLLCNEAVSQFVATRRRLSSGEQQQLPDDTEQWLLKHALNQAQSAVERWQLDEYRRLGAIHLLQPVAFIESNDRPLYHLWISRIGEKEIGRMVTETHSESFRQHLNEIRRVPQIQRDI